jgi:phosphatidylglycerophosphate synthase
MDGYMARKYGMTLKFGDLYDHISDIAVGGGLMWTVWTVYKDVIGIEVVVLFAVVTWLMNKHLGC